MSASYLYYSFWIIFIILFLGFLTIKFVVSYLKINGVKPLFSLIFKKDNKLIIGITITFTIIFWLSFYNIYYIRNYPSLRITEFIQGDDFSSNYATGCQIGNTCKIKKLNINLPNKINFEIINYSRNTTTFKLDTTMYLKKCEDCSVSILKANKEYKLSINESIFLEVIDNTYDNQVYYIIDLY